MGPRWVSERRPVRRACQASITAKVPLRLRAPGHARGHGERVGPHNCLRTGDPSMDRNRANAGRSVRVRSGIWRGMCVMSLPPFNPSRVDPPAEPPGMGDDVACWCCGAKALDTGLECAECGTDNYEAVTGKPFAQSAQPPAGELP